MVILQCTQREETAFTSRSRFARQAVTTEADSRIVNDANLSATATIGNPRHPLGDLPPRDHREPGAMTIVKGLPGLAV